MTKGQFKHQKKKNDIAIVMKKITKDIKMFTRHNIKN